MRNRSATRDRPLSCCDGAPVDGERHDRDEPEAGALREARREEPRADPPRSAVPDDLEPQREGQRHEHLDAGAMARRGCRRFRARPTTCGRRSCTGSRTGTGGSARSSSPRGSGAPPSDPSRGRRACPVAVKIGRDHERDRAEHEHDGEPSRGCRRPRQEVLVAGIDLDLVERDVAGRVLATRTNRARAPARGSMFHTSKCVVRSRGSRNCTLLSEISSTSGRISSTIRRRG